MYHCVLYRPGVSAGLKAASLTVIYGVPKQTPETLQQYRSGFGFGFVAMLFYVMLTGTFFRGWGGVGGGVEGIYSAFVYFIAFT